MFPRRPSSGKDKSDTYEQGAPKRKDKAMPISVHSISPCLWFDGQAEEAANFYVSVFENSRIGSVSRFSEEGYEVHGGKAGSVMTVEFEIRGQTFVALNGGPHFKFNEAVSFQVYCDAQKDIDYFWEKLSEGGQEGPCGWLKDRYGVSWQVVPIALTRMLMDSNAKKVRRVTGAFLQMKKFDIDALKRAFEGDQLVAGTSR
jgi:predicted 3-demethylubiquinone-9 3-methyltransferase (glyoxalase superfamily)